MHYPGQGKNWGLLKSLSYLQTITLITYAANLHNRMILSETSEVPPETETDYYKEVPQGII